MYVKYRHSLLFDNCSFSLAVSAFSLISNIISIDIVVVVVVVFVIGSRVNPLRAVIVSGIWSAYVDAHVLFFV